MSLVTKQEIKVINWKGRYNFTIPKGTKVSHHTAFEITDPRYNFIEDFKKWLPLVGGLPQLMLIHDLEYSGYHVDLELLEGPEKPLKMALGQTYSAKQITAYAHACNDLISRPAFGDREGQKMIALSNCGHNENMLFVWEGHASFKLVYSQRDLEMVAS